jgi:hypothetical protein
MSYAIACWLRRVRSRITNAKPPQQEWTLVVRHAGNRAEVLDAVCSPKWGRYHRVGYAVVVERNIAMELTISYVAVLGLLS